VDSPHLNRCSHGFKFPLTHSHNRNRNHHLRENNSRSLSPHAPPFGQSLAPFLRGAHSLSTPWRESALRTAALVLHEGGIILRVETAASSGHICDISKTFTDRLRIDGRLRRYDNGSTGVGDGSKNAVERCLKANHLALHDILAFEAG